MMGLAEQALDNKTISIDSTYLKAHPTASSLELKKGYGRLIGSKRLALTFPAHNSIVEVVSCFGPAVLGMLDGLCQW